MKKENETQIEETQIPSTEEQPKANGTSKELAVRNNDMQMDQVSINDLDKLESAQATQYDLVSEYWTPETVGEMKRVIFDRIGDSDVLDQQTGELIALECAFFFTKEGGRVKQIRNGSKRLVGAIQSFNIQRGTALQLKYMGKKQNRTNGFKSDQWAVTPLIINVPNKD